MSSENENPILAALAEGGLPLTILAGSAGRAVSRLIGEVVEIPIALLKGVSQNIKDNTAVKSNHKKLVGDAVTAAVLADPFLMERAQNNFMAKEGRRQVNKEAIAMKVIEDFQDNPLIDDGSEPSDDFMNRFEGYAENASSDDLRQLYAKLLVGEIRNAGSISPATLHFASMLESDTTQLINRVLPHATRKGHVYKDAIKPPFSADEEILLEIAGFWVLNRTVDHKMTKNEYGTFTGFSPLRDELGFITHGAANQIITMDVYAMSRAGIDLLKIINQDFDVNSLVEILCKKGATKCSVCTFVRLPNDRYRLENPRDIPCPVPPAS